LNVQITFLTNNLNFKEMKKNAILLTALSLVLLLVTSCAKLPQVELDAANASLEAAKSVEANRYLTPEFNALQDSLNAVTVAIEAEKSKLFISRSYEAVKEQLVKITADAEALKLNTEERKVQVRDEVQQSLVDLTSLIAETKELLAKAPKGKEGKAALEAIQNDITIIESSVNEINTLIGNGDYLTAQDKVNASKAKAQAIKEELTNAISKVRR
jgi:hypothetical protein